MYMPTKHMCHGMHEQNDCQFGTRSKSLFLICAVHCLMYIIFVRRQSVVGPIKLSRISA